MGVGAVEVIHGVVEAREDGGRQEVRHGLLKELLSLRFTQDYFIIQRRVRSSLRVHGQVLEVYLTCRIQTHDQNHDSSAKEPAPFTLGKMFTHPVGKPRCMKTLTLEFIGGSYDPNYFHLDLGVLGVFSSNPPPHSEEDVAGREAVPTGKVTERVLGPETKLQASVGVSESLHQQRKGSDLSLQNLDVGLSISIQVPLRSFLFKAFLVIFVLL